MYPNSTTTMIAVGHKTPESTVFVVDSRLAQFQSYCDGQLLNVRHQPFEACATRSEQRGWLDAEHYSSIPAGCFPEDFEVERKALFARYSAQMIGA